MVISIRELRKREAAEARNQQESTVLPHEASPHRPIPPWMQRNTPPVPSCPAAENAEMPPASLPEEPLANTSIAPAHAQRRRRQLIEQQTGQAPSVLPGESLAETVSPPLVAESIRQAERLDTDTARPRGDGVLKFARFLESL